VPYLPETIYLMGDRQQRVAQQHSWARISHDLFGPGFASRLEAVDGAVGTCRLVFPIRTLVEPHLNIAQEILTICAQSAIGSVVVIGAIDADHLRDR